MRDVSRLAISTTPGWILFVLAVVIAVLLVVVPDAAKADVLARGELRVLAVGSGVNPEVRRTEATGTENQDTASVESVHAATNSASYLASIDRARLESSISGDNGDLLDVSIAGALSVSAGEGADVNRPHCQGSAYIAFHDQTVARSYGQLVGGDPPTLVDESVSLVVEVVPSGTT